MDLRVSMDQITKAFGTSITVTRPVPNNTPVTVQAVWLGGEAAIRMFGTFEERRGTSKEPRRVLAIPRDVLDDIPRGTQIAAAEYGAGPVRSWIADGYEHSEPDHHRVFVVPA